MKYNLMKKIKCIKCLKFEAIPWRELKTALMGVQFKVQWYECGNCNHRFPNSKTIIKK